MLGLIVFVAVVSTVPGLAQEGATVALESGKIALNETAELSVTIVPPRGLQRFDLTIKVADSSVAEIAGITAKGINQNFLRIVSQSPTSIRVQGVDLDNQITSNDKPIEVLTVSLKGKGVGTTDVTLASVEVFDEEGSPYSVTTNGATLEVTKPSEEQPEKPEEPEESPETSPQPLPGTENVPQDLDGDGLLEDTNGDGAFTPADVALFALQWDSDPVQNRPSAFDFNGDGQVNSDDPFALADLLEAAQAEEPEQPENPEKPQPTPGTGVTALELTGGPFLVDKTTTVTLRLIGAPTGLQSYRVRMRTSGAAVEILSARGAETSSGLTQVTRPSKGVLEIQAVDVDDQVTNGAQNVALAKLDVRPRQPGDAEISLDVVTFIDDKSQSLDPFVRPLSMSITPVVSPVGDSDRPPRDLNGDGLFEDVNGDGSLTEADAILLALNLNSSVIQENVSRFDFNGDGTVSFADVQELRRQLQSRGQASSDPDTGGRPRT
ncbi:MAG: dockerin type I domain-containing protein [Candidatus Bipolaricaulia bacterium]